MTNIELRIAIFDAVRDIPYRIGSQEDDASCRAKAKILGDLLTRIGLKCQVVRGAAEWSALGLPNKILCSASKKQFDHFFVRVYVPERKKWVDIDASWDVGLKENFMISQWDGLSNTSLACPVIEAEKLKPFDLDFRNFNPEDNFTKSLNDWYVNLRRQDV